jgi:transglutaminase-like putative cysteine protease
VCQDFAHLMLALLRLRQIPCRYVSGYLHTEPGNGETAQSHAWIEFHSQTAGWIPFDPTHNREIDERYVVVGHGRHYDDVPPNKGIYRGNADEGLEAQVVTRVSARKPISTLYEEMEHIDVPVYPEIPERRRDRGIVVIEDAAEQQQQ